MKLELGKVKIENVKFAAQGGGKIRQGADEKCDT